MATVTPPPTGTTHDLGTVFLPLTKDGRIGDDRPLAALECATRGAASLLGIDDRVGTLAPGKMADVVVACGDVVAEMHAFSDPDTVRMVIQGGEVVVAKDQH